MIRLLSDVAKNDSRATLLTFSMLLFMACGYSLLFLSDDPMMLRMLTYAYLGGTTAVAFWLYVTNPALYLGFAWWIWFLSPMVRRVVDFEIGFFTPPKSAFILLAPYVVTGICLLDLPRYGKRLLEKQNLPFLLCMIGVLYGYLVGLPKVSPMGATVALLNWLCPLLLGFRMVALWKLAPRHQQVMTSVFTWGVLVLGAYGVYQFFFLAPWDAMWMKFSGMTSIGRPEPMEVRVFGTLDSPGPYAMVLMAGLILMWAGSSITPKMAAIPGFLAFLLAGVRGAWGGWVLAIGYAVMLGKKASRAQLVIGLVVAAVIIVPLATSGHIGERAGNRMETFSNLDEDGSLQARQQMYGDMVIAVLKNPIGDGLGGQTFDSGIINVLWQLGWPGGVLYLWGLGLIMMRILLTTPPNRFTALAGGVVTSYAALMLMGTQTTSMKGCVFWTLVGIILATHRYYAAQSPPPDPEPDATPKPYPFDAVSGDGALSSVEATTR